MPLHRALASLRSKRDLLLVKRSMLLQMALVKGIGRTMDAKVRQYQQYLSVTYLSYSLLASILKTS